MADTKNISTDLERLNIEVSSVPNPETSKTTPVNLATWIKACTGQTTKASKYLATIQQIRTAAAEGDTATKSELKKKLPGICPSGLHPSGSPRHENKLSGHSGYAQLDLDFVDNEHLFNTLATDIETLANTLKEGLSLNPFVLYAGLSVSGAGLWLLIPVSNQGDHKPTYAKIKHAFESMGIVVDPKAGRTANDLRLLSYDLHPVINPNAKVFPSIKEQPKPKPAQPPRQPAQPPKNFDPDRVLDKIRNANEGERHGQILKASHLMGGYVASGAINYDDAYELLEIEGNNIKNSPSEVARTVRDGLHKGMERPIEQKQKTNPWNKPPKPKPKPSPEPSPQPSPEPDPDPEPSPQPDPEPEPVATFNRMAAKNPKLNELADRLQLDIHNAEKSSL